jgi:hypothetical protein
MHPPVVRSVFDGVAELSRRVPVVALRIPWGPPFRHDLGHQILSTVRAAVAETSSALTSGGVRA